MKIKLFGKIYIINNGDLQVLNLNQLIGENVLLINQNRIENDINT